MLEGVPDDEVPDAEPEVIAAGVEYKEGKVKPGPASMEWLTPEDDGPTD